MTVRKLHRIIGLAMLAPFAGWAITGLVFFVKPGYGGAYEPLNVKTYPLDQSIVVQPQPTWREFRYLKTVLGTHVLARTDAGWSHLDAATMQPLPRPGDDQVRRLVADAFTMNPQRYGDVASIVEGTITTTTGAKVTLDWNRLSLQQRGRDTDRIDALYRVHYLQWTGVAVIDRALGFAGLTMVITLAILGARLALKP